MIFQKINAFAFANAVVACLSLQQLHAGSYGSFIYTEKSGAITITDCNATGHVTIPTTIDGKPVTTIGFSAFSHSTVTGVTIPYGVTSIEQTAFIYCRQLTEINLPESLTSLGMMAFLYCSSLQSVTIPSSLTSTGGSPFMMCPKLKSAVVAEGSTTLPADIFASCDRLEEVVFPSTLVNIGEGAFRGCSRLKTIVLPEDVHTIGQSAFYGTAITRFTIPKNVRQVAPSSFSGCEGLQQVVLPENIAEIGDNAFSGCPNLGAPIIPASVKRIGKNAFAGSGFATISIPASVRTIDDSAFAASPNLVSVLLNGDAPLLGKKVFDKTPGFAVFIENGKKGYTVPKWKGYPVSTPKPEISLTLKNVSFTTGVSSTKFGNVLVGAKSPAVRFTIQNVGNRKLTQLAAKIKDGASKDFQVTRLGKSSLAPGKSTFVDVVFTPTKKGSRVSKLQIRSNDADEGSFEVEVRGVGLVNVK